MQEGNLFSSSPFCNWPPASGQAGTLVSFHCLQLISKALDEEKEYLVTKGIAAHPLLAAQQPFLLPARARGGEWAGSLSVCNCQEAPLTQHKLGLLGTCPNQDPACQPWQSRHLISNFWGRFWSALAGKATWPRWHGSIIPSFTQEPVLYSCWHSLQAHTEILAQDPGSTGCLSSHSRQLLLILSRLCACSCEVSEFVVRALSPKLL